MDISSELNFGMGYVYGGMECECMERNVCMGVLASFQTASNEKLGGTWE